MLRYDRAPGCRARAGRCRLWLPSAVRAPTYGDVARYDAILSLPASQRISGLGRKYVQGAEAQPLKRQGGDHETTSRPREEEEIREKNNET